jgi:hypothetical protein
VLGLLLVSSCAADPRRAQKWVASPAPKAEPSTDPIAMDDGPDVETISVPVDEQHGPRIELTWFVHAEGAPDPSTGIASRPVALELRTGSHIRRFALGEQMGNLIAKHQSACKSSSYPNEGDQVAKITFFYGGTGGFAVRRAPSDTLTVVAWSQPDGGCMNAQGQLDVCPGSERRIAVVHVGGDDPIAESVVELDAGGQERRLACPASSLPD